MFLRNTLMAAALVAPATLFAADEMNVSTGFTAVGAPLALHGVDTVALTSGAGLTPGAAKHTALHEGAAFYFASAEAKAQFEANPNAYLAQFGGFCTLGVSKGKKLDGNPRFSDVRNGKLYVFLNAAVFEAYQADKDGVIATAEANWPGIRSTPVADL